MNFSPFGGHFPASIPTIHQFAAKFGTPDTALGGAAALGHNQDMSRYSHGPGVATSTAATHFNQHHSAAALAAMPVNMGKFRSTESASSGGSSGNVQGGNSGHSGQQQSGNGNGGNQHMMNGPTKYHAAGSNLAQHYAGPLYAAQQPQQQQQQQAQSNTGRGVNNERQDKRNLYGGQQNQQELCAALLQQQQHDKHEKVKQEQDNTNNDDNRPGSNSADFGGLHQQQSGHLQQSTSTSTTAAMPASWQSLAAPGSTVADYLSHLPASTLPLSLHHFLKYSAENIKKETVQTLQSINTAHQQTDANNLLLGAVNGNAINQQNPQAPGTATTTGGSTSSKKKKKKKAPKEKKPRPKPGEIRLTTALDGSTLYCCPECHMAYPEKELLEQHLVGHTLERRFVCDICGAGLKRKDHLTRHKQSHNPERPYVCTVCLKAFKRKEQLTLHFVIHSGEKRHICPECGKGFYRKDHLRKHTRSHIARRVKAELSQQAGTPNLTGSLQSGQVAAPGPPAAQPNPQQAIMS